MSANQFPGEFIAPPAEPVVPEPLQAQFDAAFKDEEFASEPSHSVQVEAGVYYFDEALQTWVPAAPEPYPPTLIQKFLTWLGWR